MAAGRLLALALALALVQAALVRPAAAEPFPSAVTIKSWVDKMQEDLVTLAKTASGVNQLVDIYEKYQDLYTVEPNNARQLVEIAARDIEKLLSNRSKALVRLALEAEKVQAAHQWREDFASNEVVYYNAKDDLDPEKNESEPGSQRIKPVFIDDANFGRQISYQHAAVHIPTDIYEGSTIVLNELNWTSALDEVFKKNREEDPSLLWQVFGSATGLARYYPASPWVDNSRTPNKIDLYDVRRRPWYIQGAASPKDMLILVDVSGSVSGLTLKLIRTSVSEMLETLSDDDFVNVASFNSNAQDVSCFQHLVQANVRNKKVLKDAVNNITAKGITDYKKGFSFAFEQLLNYNVSRANCNKIIMLFTDGGEERAQEIFAKYNKDKKVRVFTFSVGQHNYDRGPIQWMACENKGYYYEIPSIGAIRINTQEYLDVLGRPMVLAGDKAKQVQWTNVYLDALELGLVITGTLPVFNITGQVENKTNLKNQLILGVMGVDVSLEDIKRLTPRFTLCPNGYYFAIDPNGYVLLHPNLQPKPIGVGIPTINLRKRRPNVQEPVTLDFLDAELENDIKVEIRNKMIDGESGEKTFRTLVKSQDERYIDKGNRTYTWTPVNGTDYSLALVLPTYSFYYIKAKIEETITQARSKKGKMKDSETLKPDNFDESGYTFIAPRDYCNDLKISDNNTEFLLNFNEFIDRKTPNNPSCNTDLINRVLLDAGFTNELVQNYWSKQKNIKGVKARFVVTDGGITRVYPKEAGENWQENPETYEDSFYKRSLDNDNYVFTAPYFNKSGPGAYESGIMVSKAVEIYIQGKLLKPAVVGIKIDVNSWIENFTKTSIRDPCAGPVCDCKRNSDVMDCVILDDGGFLLMANHDDYTNQIGRFFGEIDPSLMRHLVNISVYAFNKSYDYQSVCEPGATPKQGAGHRSAYVPSVADILHIGWWATAAAWSILQQFLLSLTFPRLLEAVEMEEEDFTASLSKQSCITEQTQYFFDNDSKSFSGVLDCGNCSRIFHVEKLMNTNLIFIMVESKGTCPCDTRLLIQAEQTSDGPDPCDMVKQPRYRKGPDVCFDNNVLEDYTDCGGVSGLNPSLWSIIGVQFVLLWLLSGSRHCQL
ncbi:voltage-dependent calcium channel subunit alpha-2/delta-1 isoform X2 [Canis lupus baileyi]|uniref:voltage-dependent calcium channel subunit alpha-2/delta-1 isoform X2 n=1 Tax=Canis lupus dingo TaxID=286419 RepID=UPI000DC74BD5|nr:voltage-dependent calcium channel subunit alpha-2/delta-1 isoform X2 [Canis lupus dingo]XP_038279851.1 voltage-dependent calcium channel subunit alpha-2/delta-1 isoform X2 [Canis lupus familiaris]XP_038309722.1 voltage-dependent calcium channel subunit alpha-2/delta-1 isoform X2 [Canis lupus familiaris]XP_038418766.1 voltage-dependent calcium channel subunit alpha-2/delta-1 isoform X2 [Canis lupus familiaris]